MSSRTDVIYSITKHIVFMCVSVCIAGSNNHTDCEPGYYRDSGKETCSPCSGICTATTLQENRDLCPKMCPDWSPRLPIPPQPPPITENVTQTATNATTSNLQCLATIIALSLGGLVAVMLAVVITCVYGRRLRIALRNLVMNRNCTRRGVPPHDDVQESTPGHPVPSAPLMEDAATRD